MGCACSCSRSVGQAACGEGGGGAPSAVGANFLAKARCFKPTSEAARLQAVLDCHQLDTPAERRFDDITQLVKDMLQVPICVVGLIDDDRLYLKSAAGCEHGTSPRRLHSFCDASLRAPNPRCMVVPDTLLDARFKYNEFVNTPPFIRCYTGAPLISSDGHVMGSLGVMDVQPRAFPPSTINILCNFAELVVRELERDKALEQLRQQELRAIHMRTVRTLSCFGQAVCLVDAAAPGWPVLYANDKWDALLGRCDSERPSSPADAASLWDALPGASPEGRQQAAEAARRHQPLSLAIPGPAGGPPLAVLELRPASCDHLSLAAPKIAVPSFVESLGPEERPELDGLYFVVVEPAAPPALPPPQLPPIRVQPAAGAQGAALSLLQRHSFGLASPGSSVGGDHGARCMLGSSPGAGSTGSAGSSCSARSLRRFGLHCPEALSHLELGAMLGSGSYGRVYRAYRGPQTVAVKIIDSWVAPLGAEQPTKAQLEALLSQRLEHPCIVRTLEYAWQDVEQPCQDGCAGDGCDGSSAGSSAHPSAPSSSRPSLDSPLSLWSDQGQQAQQGRQLQQMWLVQEYCDHGTLGDAVDRGWLRRERDPDAPADTLAVLLTAQASPREIARALGYLHSQGIIHADLTPDNVLLSRAPAPGGRHPGDPRPFRAQVSDFGLSRMLQGDAVQTITCGCITHMPLELIQGERLSKAVDTYAFGTMLWEMLAGERAWADRNTAQILYARTIQQEQLMVPAGCPPALKALAEACLHADHTQRPSFEAIEQQLAAMLAAI